MKNVGVEHQEVGFCKAECMLGGFRGKPRRWTDLTDTLGQGRLEQFRAQAPQQASKDSGKA